LVDPKEGVEQNPTSVGDTDDPESVLGFIGDQKTGNLSSLRLCPLISRMARKNPCLFASFRDRLEAEIHKKRRSFFVGPNFPDLKTLEKEITQIELDLPKETEIGMSRSNSS